MINKRSAVYLLQCVALILGAVTVAYWSLQKATANAWYFSSLYSLQNWQQNPAAFKESDYQSMLLSIGRAVEQDPTQPHYLHIKANIITLGISQHWLPKSELVTARELLLDSINNRKAWPKSWIELARVQAYLEGVDEQVINYISRAEEVGPYDFDVHKAVVEIMLQHWSNLQPQYKAYFFKHLLLALRHGYKFVEILKIAKQSQQLPLVCLILDKDSRFEEIKRSWMNNSYCAK
ncbi:VpsP family polysaccharide biosynthesis protein [Pseudoalteromonas sp.]|uniref:VpsP family polysaccharide biosynthesis protein n=1 Tax=Pseudoalteromonas sp. TaxID=53249 RepID=UPI003002DB2F